MAESNKPTSGINSSDLLPKFYNSDSNKKFLKATVDQLVQPGTVNKINGYIGRQNAKASSGADIFIKAPTDSRQQYQLEPGFVVKDSLDNTTFFKDYQDYINQISIFGGNTANHSRLNEQEFYSWDPHICWDKFVNFQNYYWLPYGPDVIKITGQSKNTISEYNVTVESELDSYEYVFSPDGLTRNPSIKLFKGQTYKFNINSIGNPFSIKTERIGGDANRYQTDGLVNGIETGVMTFTVPHNAPNLLYYMSESDLNLGGVFEVFSIDQNTFINVETDILGKVSYTLPNGTSLSNGMKVSFTGNVLPEIFATGQYYVEGVGTAIRLILEQDLELISAYTDSTSILFDSVPFDGMPFSDATSFAGKSDYIVINRASQDRNPWSRYNRWFHKDAIYASATFNGNDISLDQSARATRPIIEFEAGLKLFNFGMISIPDIDLIDDYTSDVFSIIEGSQGYNIDGVQLVEGHRVLFVADTDSFVKNNVYIVHFITTPGTEIGRQIHLELESRPLVDQVVLVKAGKLNQGVSYWYSGSEWKLTQQKFTINQSPLFDIVDNSSISFGDKTTYDGTTFIGTKIFSYKTGVGSVDTALGFPLSYKNINNIGDIVFNFDILFDTFKFKELTSVVTQSISTGNLIKLSYANKLSYTNAWKKAEVSNSQAAIRIYKNTQRVNNFNLDIFDNIADLTDLVVIVYKNGIRVDNTSWTIEDGPVYKQIVLTADILITDVITLRAFASQPINTNGYYEIPINLQNNPLNDAITEFTLGEVIDHVNSIVDNLSTFTGIFPGASNLRDLGNITALGTKFIQHSGPMSLSMYHITSDTNNIARAIESARDDYNSFKRNFMAVAEVLGVDTDPVSHVDLILNQINKDRPKNSPYYFSDMVGYTGKIKTEYTVLDSRITAYPLTNVFNLDNLSNSAVNIYLNGSQLLFDKDYSFNSQGFVIISAALVETDTITICEYENTDGCFIPATPSKLGIWPKFEPKIYWDTSLVTPRMIIQGHDGSQVLAYEDFRDALILELETRIFNNIKVKYDDTIFDINKVVPLYNIKSPYSLIEFNQVLAPSFYTWTSLVDRDFTKPLSFDRNNSMTYNYRGHVAPDGRETPGYWRGIYRWLLGTDRPNICPWEMLGFSIEPKWWTSVYGPAPYTSDNLVLWKDLSEGLVNEPGTLPIKLSQYVRPYLINCIPVNQQGDIISPYLSNLSTGIITQETSGDFIFGDVSPVEAAWRRSSHYPFSVLLASLLLTPANTLGLLLDRSRIVRNLTGQLVYKDTGLRIRPTDIVLPSIYSSSIRVQTAGIINYIVDYILSDSLKSYTEYKYDLTNIQARLSHRIGAFTSKEKFNLLLDSKSPTSQGNVFIPVEDYDIILNSSSPVKKLTYSGVIITRLSDGYEVKGYSKTQPYFKYYPWVQSGPQLNVGGISENYTIWTPGQLYPAGKVVLNASKYFRTTITHTALVNFDSAKFQALPTLPMIGGQDVTSRKLWDRTSFITVPYGTKFRTIQETFDFLVGYGEFLKDEGFIFDDFNNSMASVSNWDTSAKEFLFWTTQNWSTGKDKWKDWLPDTEVEYDTIVRYNGDYYRAITKSFASASFTDIDFVKLDGLSTVGSSVISLSPAAAKITFTTPYSVVDDIRNAFNGYEIFKVDGTPVSPEFLNSYRGDGSTSYSPANNDGIYGASFYLIQKEQVVIFNNSTIFNDTIYNPESGYRQERIKVASYVTTNWNGAFDAPGFIFDQAIINDWQPWTDYSLGDIVKYKSFYYSAESFILGDITFSNTQWVKLSKTPTARLLPNWTYKASQFTDFYSLDSDNFDAGQQKMAQHLIGYQKRQYLSNIIKDDVSEFKFYQGMIVEKGTQNGLNKLFDVLSAENLESLKFNEEWALRVGNYGASSSFENIEFILDESIFKSNPQGFELVNAIDTNNIDFIIRQTPNDVYLKPTSYNNKPWPVLTNKKDYLRTPGFVRESEVKLAISTLDDLLISDISTFNIGEYVWCGFEGRSWNVYRYSVNDNFITSAVSYIASTKVLTIQATTSIESVIAGEIIGITGVTGFNGFYKVLTVSGNALTVTSNTSPVMPFIETSTMKVHHFTSQRVSSIDDISGGIGHALSDGELLWTDDCGDGKWATWQYAKVYSQDTISNPEPSNGMGHGSNVAVNSSGTLLVTSDIAGIITVYDRPVIALPWVHRQTIASAGSSLALSADSLWLAVGNPSTGTGSVNLYKRDSTNNYSLISIFTCPDIASQFGSKIVFGTNKLYIGALNANSQVMIYPIVYGEPWVFGTAINTATVASDTIYEFSTSIDNAIVAVSIPSAAIILTYWSSGGVYLDLSSISAIAQSVSVSAYGNYIAIGCTTSDTQYTDSGSVLIYRLADVYVLFQTILSQSATTSGFFGKRVLFQGNDSTLVVLSGTAMRVEVYNRYASNWIFGESLISDGISGYGTSIAVTNNMILVGSPAATATYITNQSFTSGQVYQYTKLSGTHSWNILHKEIDKPNLERIKSVFLYNKVSNELLKYVDVVDSVQGKIPGIAEQELKYKTFYDPATYSVGIESVNVDNGMAWTKAQVGRLWWDLRTAKFINSYDQDIVYRNSNWNKLFPTASIDIYEWVESTLKPSEWNTKASTEAGIVAGISGTSLYGDTVYSIDIRYDNISKKAKNTYYYWVKNKTTIPNVLGRLVSAQDVADIIANPRGQGYEYLEITGQNSFSLVNIKPLLKSTDIVLSVEYWTIDNRGQNTHSEWKLISDEVNTVLPARIEQKWFDSLCGKDANDRLVPDMSLPPKLRYGIEFRPRQGMFINRFEALKQFVERVNLVLISEQIAGQKDLTLFESYDPEPSLISGLYDSILDTDTELRFANVGSFRKAVVEPIIINGSITGISVIDSGLAYIISPYILVTGDGVGAILKAKLNTKGQVIGATIIAKGSGYSSEMTSLTIRSYSVLVHSDSAAQNAWSIYSYEPTSLIWSRVRSQSYDTRKYWNYADWYATGFSQFTIVNYSVDTFASLSAVDATIGELVKIRADNSGNWLLLERYSDIKSVDWTRLYRVVGSHNGTIQISPSLYAFIGTTYGYDGALYDSNIFDNSAVKELRNILTALKTTILIDTLKKQYLEAFFSSVRYALSEQTYVDWIFKTSFVKAQHNVGALRQSVTFNNDNLADFESYVNEVKPYRTKVREYVSSYSTIDTEEVSVSDFDLQPVYIDNKSTVIGTSVTDGTVTVDNAAIQQYPWKHWLDNLGFSVTELRIADGGIGYITEPTVRFVGKCTVEATARAFIVNGRVNRIVLLTSGSGYLSAPLVVIDGGTVGSGIPARVIAIIGDGVTRSTLIKMKFDRITKSYFVTQLAVTETLIGTGSRIQFPLTWSPDIRVGSASVTINAVDTMRGDYKLLGTKSTVKGYTSYAGSIVFNSAPAIGAVILISYLKDWALLNAADRLQYYTPEVGQLGNDLSQLMTGVDYGGVSVNGLGFEANYGWDSAPYHTDRWDSFDSTFDDYGIKIGTVTHTFTLPYMPEAGTELNIYRNWIRIDDIHWNTVDQTNTAAVMQTLIASGNTNIVTIPNTVLISTGDTIIIRKSTSDGSIKPHEVDYDTALTGGDLAYTSATGLNAEDIIVDGDGFITETTCPATEELIPGQVVDSVAIKIFDRQNSASANISVENYVATGTQTEFAFSQDINSSQAVIVKVGDSILMQIDDYSVNYAGKTITCLVAPPANALVSIFEIGFASENILDMGHFVTSGTNYEFITNAKWMTDITALVYVNGVETLATLYEINNRVGIRFDFLYPANLIINFIIVNGLKQLFSITKSEKIIPTGEITYNLQNIVGNSLPAESSMLVRVNQQILNAPSNSYFTITSNRLNYVVAIDRIQPENFDPANIIVFADGNRLLSEIDYTIRLDTGTTIKIAKAIYDKYKTKQLVISIKLTTDGYLYIPATSGSPAQISFSNIYNSPDIIEIISSYNHDALAMERTTYDIPSTMTLTPDTLEYFTYTEVIGGTLPLDRAVVNTNYVWVIKNGTLLIPNIDYRLNEDKQSVVLLVFPVITDKISVITFGNNVVSAPVSYMQFKDMLNRTHYKRLNATKRTVLVQALAQSDLTIEVANASTFDIPNPARNKPGIIEIAGERIEYFTIQGNILGQLRRGTLGTGVPDLHKIDSVVQEIGVSETIPYSDITIVKQIISDGTHLINTDFIPSKSSTSWHYSPGFISPIPVGYGQSNDIEVFIGGYEYTSEWAPSIFYTIGTIINMGSYTYRCIEDHTSTLFAADSIKWQFFVGNIRLKKSPYLVHNVNQHPESPEGDIQLDAEFSVDGVSSQIRLTNLLKAGTRVTIVKKTTGDWSDDINIRDNTSIVGQFINAVPGSQYSGFTK